MLSSTSALSRSNIGHLYKENDMNKALNKTLQDLVRLAAEEYGDRPYIREKAGKELVDSSFSRLYSDSRKIAAYLGEKFNGETIHAAIIGPTSYAWLSAYFGTVVNGNVTVPLDAQLGCEDICELMTRADVSAFFYDKRYEPMIAAVRAACPEIKAFICLQDGESADITLSDITAKYTEAELKTVTPKMLASIVYTSGTTGKAKGVMLSHGNLIDNTNCQDDEAEVGDITMTVLPIHHVYCFTCDILLGLRYGTTVCVNDSMMRIAMNLQLFKPSFVLLVPMIAETIYKQILGAAKAKQLPPAAVAKNVFGGNLKGIYSGGAYLAPELVNGYLELGIPIAQGYGMTECSPRISTASFKEISTAGDVGKIVNGCIVKIVDGEIVVKSGSVMQGYYKWKEATDEALDADGWLHTGDLGHVDEATNRLFITGRKKNLIILSNGENVSPEELENKFAGVDLCAEILVYAEDGVITAEIFPNKDICADITEAAAKLHEIIDEINKTIPSAKTIRKLRVREAEFDKTPSRKLKRQQTTKGEVM